MIFPDFKNRPVAFELGSEQQRFFVFVFKTRTKENCKLFNVGSGKRELPFIKKCFILSRKNIDINY